MLRLVKIVYKVMKKIGTITESRMYRREPKFCSLVSDNLFGGVVSSPEQIKENASRGYAKLGIKGGTKAAAKEAERRMKMKKRRKLEEDDLDLPMNKTPEASKMTTNAPKRTTGASTQVYNSMTDAKDPNWIQGAEKDIERRGTEGKCTPITKPGCTGRAKALAKTFKKMAKKRDAQIVSKKEKAVKKRGTATMKKETAGQTPDNQGNPVFHPKNPDFQKRQAEREKQAAAYRASMN